MPTPLNIGQMFFTSLLVLTTLGHQETSQANAIATAGRVTIVTDRGIQLTVPADSAPVGSRIAIRIDESKQSDPLRVGYVMQTGPEVVLPIAQIEFAGKDALVLEVPSGVFKTDDQVGAVLRADEQVDKMLVPLDTIGETKRYMLDPTILSELRREGHLGEDLLILFLTSDPEKLNKAGVEPGFFELVDNEEEDNESAASSRWKRISEGDVVEGNGPAAVLVHGMMSSAETMLSAARLVQSSGRFERVFAYQYDWKHRIAENGERLAKTLRTRRQDKSLTIFAHSMGGLVSRSALTDQAAASKVEGLMTMGTPNLGVPINASLIPSVFFITKGAAPGVADLLSSSQFIRGLNSTPLPMDVKKAAYIGRRHETYMPHGIPVGRAMRFVPSYWLKPFDGIVPVWSSSWDLQGARMHIVRLHHGQLDVDLGDNSDVEFANALKWWFVLPPR